MVVLLRVDPLPAMSLDGKLRRRGEREDRPGEVEAETGRQDESALDRSRIDGLEGCSQTGRVGCLAFDQFDAELARGVARLVEEWRGRHVVSRIDEREQAQRLRSGQDLPVDLELLDDRVSAAERPRQIAARVGEAVHQAVADWVRRMEEDDRDTVGRLRGGLLRRRDGCVLERDDQVDTIANELLGLRGGLVLAVEIAPDEVDTLTVVLPLDLLHPAVHELSVADQLLHHLGGWAVKPAEIAEAS